LKEGKAPSIGLVLVPEGEKRKGGNVSFLPRIQREGKKKGSIERRALPPRRRKGREAFITSGGKGGEKGE